MDAWTDNDVQIKIAYSKGRIATSQQNHRRKR